jgi:peptidoglycan hydrolase-like protein with peptidoglycan-binding domain
VSSSALLAATGGKQPNGRFRPGVISPPYAEHDLAHYVIDAFAAGLARSGVAAYLEYDPEMTDDGPVAIANTKDAASVDMVAFDEGRRAGVCIEIAADTKAANRAAAEDACRRVADACKLDAIGVVSSERPWVTATRAPAWWVSLACLDADEDRRRVEHPDFLRLAGEALAAARCGFAGVPYRDSDRGSVPVPGADRVKHPTRTRWFAENHPTLGLGAGCHREPNDPTAHAQTMLGVLVDGRFGYNTQSALQAVQRRFGLTEDGVCGAATWAVLHAIERQGSVGYTTKEIQRELGIHDDGLFGPITAAHVEAFQRAINTVADGRVAPDLYRAMLDR